MSRHQRMQEMLSNHLQPYHLEILDESNQHRRQGVETHFTMTIVSAHFNKLSRLARHRLVNALMDEEFKNGLHALSLHLYTPEEWDNKPFVLKTPACQHATHKSSH
jgi:BolA protein